MIEILATLLVITIGMLAVIGMILYATVLASRAQAATTGMATALTVLDDPTPLTKLDWSPASGGLPASGYINGYYVTRLETSSQAVADGLVSVEIKVEVYETIGGALVSSVAGRRMRRR
jgi:Tfp pilus assembly protein PilV